MWNKELLIQNQAITTITAGATSTRGEWCKTESVFLQLQNWQAVPFPQWLYYYCCMNTSDYVLYIDTYMCMFLYTFIHFGLFVSY